MSKYTPGPWEIKKSVNFQNAIYRCDHGYVAFIPDDDYDKENERANACLISAAPDLLECLKEVMELLDPCVLPEEVKKFRDVIKKANGDSK